MDRADMAEARTKEEAEVTQSNPSYATFDEWWAAWEGRAWNDLGESQGEEIWLAGVASQQTKIEELKRLGQIGYRRAAHYEAVVEAARSFVNTPYAEPRLADSDWSRLLG